MMRTIVFSVTFIVAGIVSGFAYAADSADPGAESPASPNGNFSAGVAVAGCATCFKNSTPGNATDHGFIEPASSAKTPPAVAPATGNQ